MLEVVVLGPTGSGKSAASLELAAQLQAAIVAVDARTVYRGFSIGTAKPEAEDLLRIPHGNINVLDADQKDTPTAFMDRVCALRNAHSALVYCGGSTLYLQQLVLGSDMVPERRSGTTELLAELATRRGKAALLALLNLVDPEYALRVDGFNPVRIYRALDVWLQTGRPFSSYHALDMQKPLLPCVFGLRMPWEVLAERIRARTRSMFKAGLVEETASLLQLWPPTVPAFRTVGYAEVLQGLASGWDQETMQAAVERNTLAYAKRQITWFKRWPFIQWIDVENLTPEETAHIIRQKIG